MVDERTLDLINADVDGELTPEQSQELDAILEASADARAMRAELLRLTNLLDNQPAVNPPADLAQNILQQIKWPEPAGSFSLAGLFSSFQPATAGLAFAAGLLATVSFYELAPDNRPGTDIPGIVGSKEVEIEVAFAEAGLGFGGIAHAVIDHKAADESYEVSGGTLRVVNQGRQSFTVFLLNAASDGRGSKEIDIVVSSGEARVIAGVLRG